MSIPPQPPGAAKQAPAAKPTYISSSGHTLSSLPLTARLNRAADSLYNFVGLYFVSLLSLDPYSAAQNSRFNTRGPGRNVNAARTTSASTNTRSAPLSGGGSTRLGGGTAGSGLGGPRGGGSGGASGGAGPGTGGRRMGTVDDVRGPECGSCG